MVKQVLGRGLGALLNGNVPVTKPAVSIASSTPSGPAPAAAGQDAVIRVPLDLIRPCPFQPRKDFSEEAIRELADSIKEQGIVQPLLVRVRGDGYELITGERRWRAARLLGLGHVPVMVREADDPTALELALIENLQRENLNPLEEAQGYEQLIGQFHLTQEEAAARVGKSRAAVANALRLLRLAPPLQAYLRDGLLSAGHAKVILGLENPEAQNLAAERIIKAGLNVRQTEELVDHLQRPSATASPKGARAGALALRDAHVVELEHRLQERFGTRVSLRYRKGKGAVEIRFFSDEELERILQIAGIKLD